jgi:hypothetical protein
VTSGLVQIPSPSGETTENIQDFIVEVVCAEQIYSCHQIAWAAVHLGRRK